MRAGPWQTANVTVPAGTTVRAPALPDKGGVEDELPPCQSQSVQAGEEMTVKGKLHRRLCLPPRIADLAQLRRELVALGL